MFRRNSCGRVWAQNDWNISEKVMQPVQISAAPAIDGVKSTSLAQIVGSRWKAYGSDACWRDRRTVSVTPEAQERSERDQPRQLQRGSPDIDANGFVRLARSRHNSRRGLWVYAATAVAKRQSPNAVARNRRWVLAVVRWRPMLNRLYVAACMDRNRCAERADLNP